MEDKITLAELHKKMQLEDLKTTLAGLWTVCPDAKSDPLDYYIDGIAKGTMRLPPGPTGTEKRIHFSRKDSSYL